MFRNLFFAAVLAALCAGLLTSAIQHFRVTPLILHAESFEGAGHSHGEEAVVHEHADGTSHVHEDAAAATTAGHDHGGDWAPQDGFERTAYTVLANLLVAAGFALVLGAVSMLAGLPITFANGLVWGAAGFVVFSLAPAYGLPPELPGMPAGDLMARQIWWIATAVMTGAALLLLAKTRAGWAFAVAALLIIAPHVIGAPAAPEEASAVPAHLATAFAANTLGTAAVFWAVLGLVFGRLNDLFADRTATQYAGKGALA
ncbi:hypothetical protein GCM10007989_28580 [Devosia pacifica]|uniref:Cobalt transporter n=1 Tax=Devosia pacifica TaxID=1335967 RepID=A0A918VX82_9HYPH|nr:CbtA family protein [Devosia pacifica]GHA30927.1 hypothetical protein GCM10007989_28580 [Devosia pacifica]